MTFRLNHWLTMALIALLAFSPLAMAKSEYMADNSDVPLAKETYLTEAEVAFIRPGLDLEILDVVIPTDLQPEVTFKLTDPAGLPLDRDGVFTPGPVSTSFILSFIPEGEGAYVAYTTRVQTSPITGDSAVQASTDSGGEYTDLGDGTYMYKFGTVLPEDYPTGATHTLGMYARRDLEEWDLGRYVANALDSFIPSGTGTPMPRDIVTTDTCNSCHNPLELHGGSRREVGLCILCHNPSQSIDPDTGNSVDMPLMTHKIHAGAHLANGYTIIGYRQSVHDYSHVEFTAPLEDCEVCHTGGVPNEEMPFVANPDPAPVCDGSGFSMTDLQWGDAGSNTQIRVNSPTGPLMAAGGASGSAMTGKWVKDGTDFYLVQAGSGEVIQELKVNNTVFGCAGNPPGYYYGEAATDHTAWMTNPSRSACGSCHDRVDFENGTNHPVQLTDENCGLCHQPASGNEYDFSVKGAHTVPYKSDQLKGFLVTILDIQNTDPGDRVTVTFSMTTKAGRVQLDEINRLRFSLSGPNTDFSFYEQETATNSLKKVGPNWSYTFNARLPDEAMGSFTLGVEGRLNGEINGESVSDQMQNFTEPFAVTDTSTVGRRIVVEDAVCEKCHSNLSLHGENRHDATGYCQTCHMPSATDEEVRPEDAGAPQSIDFRYMIHQIHRGAELENGYIVYGYRGSLNDFSEVEFMGDLRDCESCHVDGSYTLPLPAGLEDVTTPQAYFTPMGPETASCLSCHDSEAAAVHAKGNSNELGEACAACHGTGKTYSVEKVHAR
jgi:hypothetical protein